MTTTLLAVDDSVTMRKVLEITFGGESYRTVLAASASEALSLAKSERPSLVLLDHTLSDMSGYDLCRELKVAVPNLAVVMLSSKVSPYDKGRGSASGVDDFMDKPFDTQKLLDKVAQVLSQPRAAAPVAAPAPVAAAPAPVAAAPAPVAPAQGPMASAAARPRSQTLSYGASVAPAPSPQPSAAAASGPGRTLTGTQVPTPRPPVAASAPAAPAARPVAPAPQAAPVAAPPQVAAAAAAAVAGNGQLTGQLQAMGLTPAQVEGVLALSREVIEKVVWEVVPVLAETLIREEIRRLTAD